MRNRSEIYRAWSAECLDWAHRTTDKPTRLAFLTMAKRWMEIARESQSLVGQQQQQIQPKIPGDDK